MKILIKSLLTLFFLYFFNEVSDESKYLFLILAILSFLWLFKSERIERPSIKPSVRMKILRRDKYICQKCGRKAPEVKLEVDHIIPWSWNKTREMSENIRDYITLCRECNIGKGNKFSD